MQEEERSVIKEKFLVFLSSFRVNNSIFDDDDDPSEYHREVLKMRNKGSTTLYVDFQQLYDFDRDFATKIKEEFIKLKIILNNSLLEFVEEVAPDYIIEDERTKKKRDFFVSFFNLAKILRLRDLKTARIGKLCSVSGTITRTSEVKPELYLGAFECDNCFGIVDGITQDFKLCYPKKCTKKDCQLQYANASFTLLPKLSSFVDWQKVRVQESSDDVPVGSMPRTITVILRNEVVEKCKPGDHCLFTGSLIAVPDVSKLASLGEKAKPNKSRHKSQPGVVGLKALGVRDMSYSLAFIAENISFMSSRKTQREELQRVDETKDEIREEFSEEDKQLLFDMSQEPNLLSKMRRSVAPNIFGHEDIKLGMLLLLFGGVHKTTASRTKLRGDINICLVGDPSTAKSQFLKYVCSLMPRAVYTSGKASTAAGLTATVVKDPDSGEFCVEAGALMLADNGICCIDEFDKMDELDQTAIHEAMEQQTISITKAGIQATLNARTSILAAANPIYGRYDRSKSLRGNLRLSPAIMSRFDLFFIVLDEPDEDSDRAIAEHLVKVHEERQEGNFLTEENIDKFTKEELQKYIRYARTIDPIIAPEVQEQLVDCYVRLRSGESNMARSEFAYRVTVRQFEALIRLSEALARLHLDTRIRPRYVEWAFNLLKTSIVKVDDKDARFQNAGIEAMPGSAIEFKADMTTNKALQASKSIISYEDYDWIQKQVLKIFQSINLAEGEQRITLKELMEKLLTITKEKKPSLSKEGMIKSAIDRLIKVDGTLISEETEKENMPSVENQQKDGTQILYLA